MHKTVPFENKSTRMRQSKLNKFADHKKTHTTDQLTIGHDIGETKTNRDKR